MLAMFVARKSILLFLRNEQWMFDETWWLRLLVFFVFYAAGCTCCPVVQFEVCRKTISCLLLRN